MNNIFSNELHLSYGDPPYDIHFEAKAVGEDILAVVTGGTKPHIGAVALAEPADALHPVSGEKRDDAISENTESDTFKQPDGSLSPTVSIITAYGHKDAILAEMFARGLCERFGANVCAAAGVHIDRAGPEEIKLMVDNAKAILSLTLAD